MTKKIYPGNYVAHLSSYQTQGVAAIPGRVYFSQVGYAKVTGTAATEFDICIPSPDLRQDDKPRADITSLVVPAGAVVYAAFLRVPDMRKDTSKGTAASGITATNGDLISVRDAAGNTTASTISATVITTPDIAAAGGTVAPTAVSVSSLSGAALTGAETLKVYVRNAADNGAGTGITSDEVGGTPLIVEVCYYLDDDAPGLDDIHRPYTTEAGAGY